MFFHLAELASLLPLAVAVTLVRGGDPDPRLGLDLFLLVLINY